MLVLGRPAAGVEVALASQSSARLMEEPTPLSCKYMPCERLWWIRLDDIRSELENECWGTKQRRTVLHTQQIHRSPITNLLHNMHAQEEMDYSLLGKTRGGKCACRSHSDQGPLSVSQAGVIMVIRSRK